MVSLPALSYLVAGFIGALVLIYFVLRSARALQLLRTPAVRSRPESSATTAGGLGFVVPVVVFLALLAAEGQAWSVGVLTGCAILLAVGLWDDLRGLGSRFRLACEVLAVAIVVWFMEPTSGDSPWQWLVVGAVAVAVLWLVNSFADSPGRSGGDPVSGRADGIVAVQSVLFFVGVQVLALGVPGWVGDMSWLLAGSVLGFLVFNWPPARIRMGNAGAMVLGLLLAVITLHVWRTQLLPLVACLILLAGFWFDATYVLCVRMLNGQALTQAVGEGARRPNQLYLKVAESRGQAWTFIAYVAFAVGWLMPLSWLTLRYAQLDLLWLALAVLPLGAAAYFLHVGVPADEG